MEKILKNFKEKNNKHYEEFQILPTKTRMKDFMFLNLQGINAKFANRNLKIIWNIPHQKNISNFLEKAKAGNL